MFFKKLVDKKNDIVKNKIIPKTDEEYVSVTYGCIRFIDSYRFLSSSLDLLVKTLFENSHKTLKDFEDEIVDNDQILNIVNEVNVLIRDDRYENYPFQDWKKHYPNEIEQLGESLLNYLGGNDLKLLKLEFPDKWKYLTKKLA